MAVPTNAALVKTVAIVQSCYIPWKGYFDLINLVDEFVLYDDGQFTRRDWRNRNRIKTPQGSQWLTIPVEVKGRYHQRIDETQGQRPGLGRRALEDAAARLRLARRTSASTQHVSKLVRRCAGDRPP